MHKRFLCTLAAFLLAALALAPAARGAQAAPPPALSACYLVMDADTGQVLIEQNADERRSPASVTKVMTMGLAMEKAQGVLDTQLTVTYDDVHQLEAGSSHIALIEGEQVRLEDILYGTEIASANDGANVLAEYIGGSIQAGVDAMNQKAGELGLEGTHFTNPHGLYDENHYSTPYDMAVILKEAADNEFCRKVLSEHRYVTTSTAEHPGGIDISNLFLRRIEDRDTHGEVLCAKTGYVDQSKNCAASLASDHDGREYICVTAGSDSAWICIRDQVALYQRYLPE